MVVVKSTGSCFPFSILAHMHTNCKPRSNLEPSCLHTHTRVFSLLPDPPGRWRLKGDLFCAPGSIWATLGGISWCVWLYASTVSWCKFTLGLPGQRRTAISCIQKWGMIGRMLCVLWIQTKHIWHLNTIYLFHLLSCCYLRVKHLKWL